MKIACELSPSWDNMRQLAKMHTSNREYHEAWEIYAELTNQGCNDVWYEVGQFHEREWIRAYPDRDALCRVYYTNALMNNPNHIGALVGLARCEPTRTITYLWRAIKLNPKHTEVFALIAKIRMCDPDSVVPWNAFEPNRGLFSLYPVAIRRAISTWLLIARRLGICKDIRLMITRLIPARVESEWNYKCMYCTYIVRSAYMACMARSCKSYALECHPDTYPGEFKVGTNVPMPGHTHCYHHTSLRIAPQVKLHQSDPAWKSK